MSAEARGSRNKVGASCLSRYALLLILIKGERELSDASHMRRLTLDTTSRPGEDGSLPPVGNFPYQIEESVLYPSLELRVCVYM